MKHVLIDKIIKDIKITASKDALLFITTEGDIAVEVQGDCCSNSWVESIELPGLGFPAKVISVDDLDMPDLGDIDGRDCIKYYGCKIITDRGEIIIDYRNESNGYYGGYLSWPDVHYGKKDSNKNRWIDIEQ